MPDAMTGNKQLQWEALLAVSHVVYRHLKEYGCGFGPANVHDVAGFIESLGQGLVGAYTGIGSGGIYVTRKDDSLAVHLLVGEVPYNRTGAE